MQIRRSVLTTPGNDKKMMEKAAASQADMVMLDLEDAVHPANKNTARSNVIKAIREYHWDDQQLSVRINNLDSRYWYYDIVNIIDEIGGEIDTITVPKVRKSADLYTVAKLLDAVEADNEIAGTVGIDALIEETEAIQNINAIAAGNDRLQSLIFGPGDYAAARGVWQATADKPDADVPLVRDHWSYARNRIVVAARSNGIAAIDGPFSNFTDTDGFREDCQYATSFGFGGKLVIHPDQIEIANAVFAPTEEEIQSALQIVHALENTDSENRGATTVDGEMIDEASIRIAQNTLEFARELGLIN